MIKFDVIKRAKNGDEKAISQILEFYLIRIKKISKDDDFIQEALSEVFRGIKKFK